MQEESKDNRKKGLTKAFIGKCLPLQKKKMLLNVSHDFSEKKEIINNLVEKPFTLEERQKLNGTSITKLPVTAASIELYNLMTLNEGKTFCSIEMRPKGAIFSFNVKSEVYSLVVPYYKLKIYKGRAEEYSFYQDNNFIKVWAGAGDADVHSFVKKMRRFKSDTDFTRIEDLL